MKTETNFSFFLKMLLAGLIVGFASECMAQAQTGNFIQQDFNGIVRYRASNLDSTKQSGFYATLPTDTFKIRLTKDTTFLEATTPVVLKSQLIYPQGASNGHILTSDASGVATWKINNFQLKINDTIAQSASGGLFFTNAVGLLRQNAQRLFWDTINNSLGIGTNTPTARLTVKGNHINSSSNALVVHDSTGTSNTFIVTNDRKIGMRIASPQYDLHIGRNPVSSSASVSVGMSAEGNSNVYSLLEWNNFRAQARHIVLSGTHGGVAQGETQIIEHHVATGGAVYGGNNRRLVIGTRAGDGASGDVPINFHINTTNSLSTTGWATAYQAGTGLVMSVRSGGVGIFTDNINASAALEISSTSKGVLLPRLTTTQINAITSPATGLTVYNTTENTLCFFNGTNWQKVTSTNL